MAVKFIAGHHRYSGLSTDTKPTTPPVGSTFRETDSGVSFSWDGTVWNVDYPVIDGFYHGALLTIDTLHYEIHAGYHYTATYTENLSSGSASVILLESPGSATAEIHLVSQMETAAAGSFEFSEAPNATAGTAIAIYNNNRLSTNTATLTITHNGAVTSAGTVLVTGYSGGGKLGGEAGNRYEWILNNSTRYLLQYVSSAASVVAWNVFWYEED